MVLDEDQKALQETARKFSRQRLLPDYQKREKANVLDRALLEEMGSLGLLAIDMPEALGGLGASSVTAGLIAEELAYGDFNISAVSVIASLLGAILLRNAPQHIVEKWIPRMTSGQAIVGVCVTEPRGGSDAANLQLKARLEGDHYIVNGEKTSITFSTTADAFVVFARTSTQEEGAKGVTALFIPSDTPGLQRTKFVDVGSHIIGRGSVFFDNVRVPVANRLGEEGKGFTQVMVGFDYSRALIALQCIGAAQASLDEAWAYTRTREAFGGPIARYQGVTFPLVDGDSMISAIRQLSYHCLALRDAGQPHTAEAAMVKWMGPKTSFDVIHQCLLTFGHYGWSMDSPHQQRMRDVMGLEIGDGTASIMKLIVARERVGRAAG
jgi:cyclohexanecarboxyl-CoA dehydrogenase